MKQAVIHGQTCHIARWGSVCGMLVLLACCFFPSRSFSQSLQVQGLTSVSIGGKSEGGGFTLRSSAGAAVPAGETQGGSFTVRSGPIATLPVDPFAPVVSHTPPGVQPSNQILRVDAVVANVESVERATLHYRRGGDASFSEVNMTESGDRVAADIPADAATSEGIAYYFTVTGQNGRTTRMPLGGVYSVRLAIPEPGITMDESIPGGTDPSSYRIVSVPLDLENKDAPSVLVDDLGPYDHTQWRFFELLFDQSLDEFPDTAPMEPGKGFWLITSEAERRIDTGAGMTMDLSRDFTVQLHPGWNLVGTPFNFPIALESVRMGSEQPFLLRSFVGHWNDPIQDPVDTLQPFRGYAVFNSLHIVDELLIRPDAAASKAVASKAGPAGNVASRHAWGIRINAQSGRSRDVDNVAAVADGATDGYDAADYPEPPIIGSYISVSFPRPDWGAPVTHFATDVRPDNQPGYAWDFEVRGNVAKAVDLRFDGVDQVPSTYDVLLVDKLLHSVQDLRISNSYTLPPPVVDEARRLQLVVGDADFVDERVDASHQVSENFEMLPSFPNPFSSGTTIRYVLDAGATVSVKVYDVAGREVAILADHAQRGAGQHTLVWDGVGSSGTPLQNGLYYVRLNAAGRVLSTAVVKMR